MNYLSQIVKTSLLAISLLIAPIALQAFEQEQQKEQAEPSEPVKNLDQSTEPEDLLEEDKLQIVISRENDEEYEGEDHNHDYNSRDGFYWGASAITSIGDKFNQLDSDDAEPEFDLEVSYRIQLLGLFVESPGVSSRQIHGLYSTPAYGINFFNDDNWSLDLFKEKTTKGVTGIQGIQNRRKDKRSGIRATGYFDNSQLQMIFTPSSSNKVGSDGIEASLSYSYDWQFKNWNYYANIGMQYRSKEILDYETTLAYTQVDPNSPAGDGVSHSFEIGMQYPLSEHWVFGSYFAYHSLSDRMIKVRQDNVDDGYRAGLLLTFVL